MSSVRPTETQIQHLQARYTLYDLQRARRSFLDRLKQAKAEANSESCSYLNCHLKIRLEDNLTPTVRNRFKWYLVYGLGSLGFEISSARNRTLFPSPNNYPDPNKRDHVSRASRRSGYGTNGPQYFGELRSMGYLPLSSRGTL